MKSITQVVENLIKPYIDSHYRAAEAIIAPVETDATSASDDYAVGKQLILNDVLYDVIAPITAGNALVVNTNIKAADNVSSDIGAKQPKTLDTPITVGGVQQTTVEGALSSLNTAKQPKTLDTPITVGGVQQTTVEGALDSINQTLTNNVSDINSALANEIAIRERTGVKNILNYEAWKKVELHNGTAVFENNGITLTSTSDDCYTIYNVGPFPINAIVPVKEGDKIKLTWESQETTNLGNVAIFPNGGTTGNVFASNDAESLSYTATSGVTFVTFRVTIYESGNTLHIKNIQFEYEEVQNGYEAYALTNQQLTPIAQAVSNRNLLDNPWFTVNQRGQASYTPTGSADYCFDRWSFSNGVGTTITKNADGTITFTNNSQDSNRQLTQKIADVKHLSNKKITLSIDVVAITGNVQVAFALNKSPWTGYVNQNVSQTGIHSKSGICGDFNSLEDGDVKVLIGLDVGASITIRAIKLELGSVSTLAQDTAPNYAEELLKCQRYFNRFWYSEIGWGHCIETNKWSVIAHLPCVMRAAPTITLSGSLGISVATSDIRSGTPTITNYNEGGEPINIGFDLAGITGAVGEVGRVFIGNSYLNFSADL